MQGNFGGKEQILGVSRFSLLCMS